MKTLLLKAFFPSLTWQLPVNEKTLYLTFDDGPIPEITPWVLKMLDDYNASATFFCVGENAKKNPAILKSIITSGSTIGNHTMSHLNGWHTKNRNYYTDIDACSEFVTSKMFRPPYGKISIPQILHLKNKFRIIMWDVLSKDYDVSLSGVQCFENVKSNAKNGSIVVFHDSIKAEKRLWIALPATLRYFSDRGFIFSAIV